VALVRRGLGNPELGAIGAGCAFAGEESEEGREGG